VDLQLEEILAEGGGFTQCESADILKKRNRARVAVLEIRELIPDIDTRVKDFFRFFFVHSIYFLINRQIPLPSVCYSVKLFNVII
jgi:hypothetical protein